MELRSWLAAEFKRRRARNPRYSARAFARSLQLHHSTLGRIINGKRRPSRDMIERMSTRLGMSPAAVDAAVSAEARRLFLGAVAAADFRPDCRWIATRTGLSVDDVQRTLHRMIYDGRLVMHGHATWTITQR